MSDAPVKQNPAPPVPSIKKWRRYAVIAGVILALVCKSLPHAYQAPCAALAKLCAGGF